MLMQAAVLSVSTRKTVEMLSHKQLFLPYKSGFPYLALALHTT